MYPNTAESLAIANDEEWDDDVYAKAQEHMETFYEEVWLELSNYGEIEDLIVLDNVSDHMIGNVYCKYSREDSAMEAVKGLTNRFYGSKLVVPEFTPVTDFREARCRAFHETRCARGGLCNFMHIKHIPRAVKRRVVRGMYDKHPDYGDRFRPDRGADRSRSRTRKKEGPKRQTSEERRAMIAEWNKEAVREAATIPPPPLGLPAITVPQIAPLTLHNPTLRPLTMS